MKKFLAILLTAIFACVALFASGCDFSLNIGDSNSSNNQSTPQSSSDDAQNSTSGDSANASNSTSGDLTSSDEQTSSGGETEPDYVSRLTEEEMELIANFVKYSKDPGTAEEVVGKANSSTATYADVPDLYTNYYEYSDDDIFASPSGSSSASGTIDKPLTLTAALAKAAKGKTVFLLGGTYKLSSTIKLSASGTRSDYINVTAWNKEEVILDFSSMALDSNNRGVQLSGKYWHISGIDFKGAGDNGMIISGSYNVIENCQFYNNRDTGLQISGSSSSPFSAWPHDNLVRYCTSYNNCDATGENADGFASKLATGNNNTFDYCISYSNSDDGWDLYANKTEIGRTIILNSISFNNGKLVDGSGTAEGDCNGFKLGSNTYKVNHYTNNCFAFNNYATGFTCNGNPGQLTVENCTSFNNQNSNFRMNKNSDGPTKVLRNLLSAKCNVADNYYGYVYTSLLWSSSYYYITSASGSSTSITSHGTKKSYNYESMFESTVAPSPSRDIHKTLRNDDLTINLGAFLKLKSTSEWASMGTDGSPLGANLNKTSYNLSAKEVDELISALGEVSRSSECYAKIYKVAKAVFNSSAKDLSSIENSAALISQIQAYNALIK